MNPHGQSLYSNKPLRFRAWPETEDGSLGDEESSAPWACARKVLVISKVPLESLLLKP